MQHTTPSAHACTQPAEGPLPHRRRYEPRNYGPVVAGAGNDPLSIPVKRPRKVATKLQYPHLPELPARSKGSVTAARFDRAAFLRTLAQLSALQAHCLKHLTNTPLSDAMWHSATLMRRQLESDFQRWMDSIDGLAGCCAQEGGAE